MNEQEYISGEEYRARQTAAHTARQPNKFSNPKLWIAAAAAAVVLVGAGFIGARLIAGNSANSGSGSSSGGGSFATGGNGVPPAGAGNGPQTCMGSSCSGNGPQTQSGFATPPVGGKVTAVSGTSITIQPTSGAARTYSITSSTKSLSVDPAKGSNNGSSHAYTAGDVKVGDSVGVVASSSDSSQADTILLNYQLQESSKSN